MILKVVSCRPLIKVGTSVLFLILVIDYSAKKVWLLQRGGDSLKKL